MALWQGNSKRRSSGGRIRPSRRKRKFEIGREQQYMHLGERRVKLYRTKGRNRKSRILSNNECNIYDPKKKRVVRAKVLTVKANPSNPNYVQRNIITKGAIVGTELGDALITSRPGQDGVLNAVLLSGESS